MVIGKMRDRITLTTPGATTYGKGDIIPSAGSPGTVWADVNQISSEEQINSGMKEGVKGYEITVRYMGGLSERTRITYNGIELQVFEIITDKLEDYIKIKAYG